MNILIKSRTKYGGWKYHPTDGNVIVHNIAFSDLPYYEDAHKSGETEIVDEKSEAYCSFQNKAWQEQIALINQTSDRESIGIDFVGEWNSLWVKSCYFLQYRNDGEDKQLLIPDYEEAYLINDTGGTIRTLR